MGFKTKSQSIEIRDKAAIRIEYQGVQDKNKI
jgi:hypothetical protein